MANLLVVDDNADLLKIQSDFLTRHGHRVSTAHDGKEAMKLIGCNQYDLVITDIVMPEKEGLEMIDELRRIHPSLKVLAMSGGGMGHGAAYLSLARKLGARDVLTKPFTGQQLIEAVRALLEN